MKTKLKTFVVALVIFGVAIFILKNTVVFKDDPKHTVMKGKWKSSFSNHVARANQVDIYDYVNKETITSIADTNEVTELIQTIQINESESRSICFCLGEYWLIFKEGTNEIATVCVHAEDYPGARLDWRSGDWPAHAVLTSESSTQFYNWIRKHKK